MWQAVEVYSSIFNFEVGAEAKNLRGVWIAGLGF
jgi:hypothetical protein